MEEIKLKKEELRRAESKNSKKKIKHLHSRGDDEAEDSK